MYPSVVSARDEFDALHWWQRLGRRRPRPLVTLKEFEEMRRISDDFGMGPIIRLGDDRYGSAA
jgi:hypothetical protein